MSKLANALENAVDHSMKENTMPEQATVHEPVLADTDALSFGGGDVASSIDRAAPQFLSSDTTPELPHHALLADAKRYRKRAQAAEKALENAKSNLAAREKTLLEQEQHIATLERRKQLDETLLQADAIDLEAARALANIAIEQMQQPDIAQAVAELRRTKPYLFRQQVQPGRRSSGAMSARDAAAESPAAAAITNAATDALESGKRIDLLRYLRLRRRA